ncbi:MAG: hypothetical protein AMXMBFR56_62020 [Polyangiaceae bacterium]
MILSDFCDEHGHVHTAVKLTGVSVRPVPDFKAVTVEQWAEKRAQILVGRRYMVVDEVLVHLYDFTFHNSFVILPGMLFEVLVDPEVRDVVSFEFEGVALSPTACLEYVELMGKEKT